MKVLDLLPSVPLSMMLTAPLLLVGCPPTSTATAQDQVQMIPNPQWETIAPPSGMDSCDRARVPGGWIVHTTGTRKAAMVFLPDPDHRWMSPGLEASGE